MIQPGELRINYKQFKKLFKCKIEKLNITRKYTTN